MEQKDTKTLILDAAESLFARQGYHATSMRNITSLARVNLAAVNYHFGSKESLLDAVFERRLVPLNEIRMEALRKVSAEADKKKRKPLVKDIFLAFIEPTLRFKESCEGAENFVSLVGQSFVGQGGTVREAFLRLITPAFLILLELLKKALPGVPSNIILWRLNFAMGALSHTMHVCTGTFRSELQRLADPGMKKSGSFLACEDGDTELLIEMLTSFISAGMEAK
jgi:AcrR family transcriptional regulator